MALQVQQLMTQMEQLTDDREALDKQVSIANLVLKVMPHYPECTAAALVKLVVHMREVVC